MDDNSLDSLLSGELESLVPLPKRVVRLFISSTFTDMMLERNSLMERVYPRLKKYCRESHGLDFQVVDMRWGVRDEATDDHQTANLCSREIDNCQRLSLGPNFVALIGDKCLIELDVSTEILDNWYREDLNAQPAEYLLQPISSILKNFTNRNEPELQSADQRQWQSIQERLHELLLLGSARLVGQGRMSERDRLMKYSISVTEREVTEGCLEMNDARSSCLVYIRAIVDLGDHLNNCLVQLKHHTGAAPPARGAALPAASGFKACEAGNGQRFTTPASVPGELAGLKEGDLAGVVKLASAAQTRRQAEKNLKLIAKYIDIKSLASARSDTTNGPPEQALDSEAQQSLINLREIKLERKLKSSRRNLSKYKISWDPEEGMSLRCEQHKSYLNDLTDHFYSNMTRMIRKASREELHFKSELISEVLQHSHYAKHVSKSFHGRHKELDEICNYILTSPRPSDEASNGGDDDDDGGDDDDADASSGLGSGEPESAKPKSAPRPMFIYGVGGSGKTSVLARAATLARDWILRASAGSSSPGSSGRQAAHRKAGTGVVEAGLQVEPSWDQSPCIIVRFCCTTPSSSSIVGVLTSVCRQLQYNFYQFGPLNGGLGARGGSTEAAGSSPELSAGQQLPYEPIEDDFIRLVFRFRQLLDNCQNNLHKNRLFVIILDSLERLSSPVGSAVHVKYSWLTSLARLPANVRLIVSCSSEPVSQDYCHLKRHFLYTYFPLRHQLDTPRASEGAEQLPAAGEQRASLSAHVARDESGVASASASGRRPSSGGGGGLAARQAGSPNGGLHWARRLVVPAVRLRRGSGTKVEPAAAAGADGAPRQNALPRVAPFAGAQSGEPRRASHSFPARAGSPGGGPGATGIGLIHIEPMGVELASEVLRRWLADAGRCLTRQQWSIVRRSLLTCSRAIFVKLAFGEIVNWKSYSMQSDSSGLTFGSALLEGAKAEDLLADLRPESADAAPATDQASSAEPSPSREYDTVQALLDFSRTGAADGEPSSGSGLKIHILGLEQQWLNYLELKAEQEERRRFLRAKRRTPAQDSGRINAGPPLTRRTAPPAQPASSSICHLSGNIEAAVCQLFARIELRHGYLLTKHSLSYIIAARNGICENELEDLLSLDDVVLDDVFQYHLPPVRRIPPLLWTRIRNDLSEFLSERDADGIVVNWHHNQFEQVTRKRYLADRKQLLYIHSIMADYFLGRWADTAKPFKFASRQQAQMAAEQLAASLAEPAGSQQQLQQQQQQQPAPTGLGWKPSETSLASFSRSAGSSRSRLSQNNSRRLQWMQAKADRRVPQQPLYYTAAAAAPRSEPHTSGRPRRRAGSKEQLMEAAGSRAAARWNSSGRRYNLRKLTELPRHLIRAERFADLANSVLFSYKWLYAMLDAFGLQSLLSDFEEAERALDECRRKPRPSPAVGEGGGADDELRPMVEQLRLLNNTIRLSSSALHWEPRMLAPQLLGRLLALARPASGATDDAHPNAAGCWLAKLLDQCDKEGALDCGLLPTDHCLQAPNGLLLSSLEGHAFGILAMSVTADGQHLLAASDRFIMWDSSTGEVSSSIDPRCEGAIVLACQLTHNNQLALGYTSANSVLCVNLLTQQVSRHQMAALCPAGILGMALIDHFAGSSFLVWTRDSWSVFRLEAGRGAECAAGSQRASTSQEVAIRLAYTVPVAAHQSLCQVQQVAGAHRNHFALVSVRGQPPEQTCTELLSGELDGAGSWRAWPAGEHGAQLAVHCADRNLGQLVSVERDSGALYLQRRRAGRWSGRKLLWPGLQVEEAAGRRVRLPLALELELEREREAAPERPDRQRADLARFEAQVDALFGPSEPEQPARRKPGLDPPSGVIETGLRDSSTSQGPARILAVLVYFVDRILVLNLARLAWGARELSLALPRGLRNSVGATGACGDGHRKSLVLEQRFLAAAVNRNLLVYSLADGALLKLIEAHGSRITRLLAVPDRRRLARSDDALAAGSGGFGPLLASASMDKSVKIWDLGNLANQAHQLERLDGALRCLSVASQQPYACALGRAQLGVWDWRTMRLAARLQSADLSALQPLFPVSGSPQPRARLLKCRMSPAGRHVCLVATGACHVFALAGSGSARPEAELRALFAAPLAAGRSVEKMQFFQQDSRLLLVSSCEPPAAGGTDELGAGSGAAPLQPLQPLIVQCFTVPEGRLLYSLASLALPLTESDTYAAPAGSQYLAAAPAAAAGTHKRRLSLAAPRLGAAPAQPRCLLPVLTRDHLHVVCLERLSASAPAAECQAQLIIYSARDGNRLGRLGLAAAVPLARPPTPAHQPAAGLHEAGAGPNRLCAWPAGPVGRLKAVAYRERGSVVALMSRERGFSRLVDVQSGQPVGEPPDASWNGKITDDGRLGLGEPQERTGAAKVTRNQPAGHPARRHKGALELLDMTAPGGAADAALRCLLSREQVASLAGEPGASRAAATAAAFQRSQVSSGFAGPKQEYAYYYDARPRKLLLVRLSDARLLASYRVHAQVTKIKAVRGTWALLLGLADGLLCSLAIVDPQRLDSLACLAEYPARARASR